ncbi:hypothetical protein GCM10029992_36570 [Glycomyces albus]
MPNKQYRPPEADGSRCLGEGLLAIGKAETDSGRWGTVYLTDLDGHPIQLRGIAVSQGAALTATALPDTDRVSLPAKRELLGAGVLFRATVASNDAEGTAVGVQPVNGRLTSWLHPLTVARLLGRRVRLETHPAWPVRQASETDRRAAS